MTTYVTTARAGVRSALNTALTAFQVANPTLLNQVYRARPASLSPPSAFIGHWSERVVLEQQLGTRLPTIEVWLVQGTYDNAETMDRLDVLADAFIAYFGDPTHAYLGDAVITAIDTDDREVTLSGANGSSAQYLATVASLALDIQQGL